MRRPLGAVALCAALILLAGCLQQRPSYKEVREETIATLQQVSDLIPEPKEIVQTPEFEPYPCGDELALGSGKGAFFTGQWAIFVDESFDVPQFIDQVPELLGEGWHEEELGIPLSFAQVHLVRDSPRMSITVEESIDDSRKAVELLAMSRCGTEEEPQ